MTIEAFARLRPVVVHVSHGDAWPQIQRHGLLTARTILEKTVPDPIQRSLDLRERRSSGRDCTDITCGTFRLRDQKQMSDSTLSSCLEDGISAADWYETLNRRIFFWVNPIRGHALANAKATAKERKLVLKLDSEALLRCYLPYASLTTFNTGHSMRRPVRRSLQSFIPFQEYKGRIGEAVELTIETDIPDVSEFVRE